MKFLRSLCFLLFLLMTGCSRWDYEHATNGAWFKHGTGIIPPPQ